MMMLPETVIYAVVSWLLMLGAFFLHRYRRFHLSVMVTVIVLDFLFPFYLYATRDWVRRLFEEGEILSFLLWTHLFLVITLYALYVVQIQAGSKLLRGEEAARVDHRGQGIGILITRALVVFTGALLVENWYAITD